MKTIRVVGFAVVFASLAVVAAPPAAKGPDLKAIAAKVVTQSAGVKEGDLVTITGDVRDIDLLEDLSIEAMKAGAEPMMLIGREKFQRRYYDEVPAKFDASAKKYSQKIAEAETVKISIGGVEFPGLLKDVAAARITAANNSYLPAYETELKRGVRQVVIDNGLYPTAANAKIVGTSKDELSKLFWGAINGDYAKLHATGEAVKNVLAAGKELHLTNPNGTDLTVQIAGRKILVSDGVITAENAKKGGGAAATYLPAGETFFAPVPGTAEGKVVIDRLPFEDGEVNGLTWTIKAGKLTAMTAKPGPGFERFKAFYDSAPAGKDVFSVIDLGINSEAGSAASSKLLSYILAGQVSVNLGGNSFAEGENATSFGVAGFLPGSTVTVDGKPLIEKGALKVAAPGL